MAGKNVSQNKFLITNEIGANMKSLFASKF